MQTLDQLSVHSDRDLYDGQIGFMGFSFSLTLSMYMEIYRLYIYIFMYINRCLYIWIYIDMYTL